MMLISFVTWSSFWSFVSPIVSGTITALVWVSLIWGYAWNRNRGLEKSIRRSLSNIGIFEGVDGMGITIDNSVHIPVIVRRVEMLLVATSGHRKLKDGERAGSLVLNCMGPGGMGAKRDVLEKDMRNFVTLRPYTKAKWGMRSGWEHRVGELFANQTFAGYKITVEYMTLLKKPRLVEIEVKDSGVSGLFNERLDMKHDEWAGENHG